MFNKEFYLIYSCLRTVVLHTLLSIVASHRNLQRFAIRVQICVMTWLIAQR